MARQLTRHLPFQRNLAELVEATQERIEVTGEEPMLRVTGGSLGAVLSYVREAYGDAAVLAREDRNRWWPRVTLTVTTDPELAASAPPLESFADPEPEPEPPPKPRRPARPERRHLVAQVRSRQSVEPTVEPTTDDPPVEQASPEAAADDAPLVEPPKANEPRKPPRVWVSPKVRRRRRRDRDEEYEWMLDSMFTYQEAARQERVGIPRQRGPRADS